ncbi:MAG: hypothetical protein J6Z30_04175 [Pyramidobacter sp.]|nr:hypothetical protein [Pyramidobacter sp.]
MEKIYEKLRDKGFEVIDIPCNQFGAQSPGSDQEIHDFRVNEYAAQYPQMKKSDVNGPDALPLYAWLKAQKGFAGFGEGPMADKLREVLPKFDPDYEHNAEIKWNFTKFVIDRDGNVAARFEPPANMGEVAKCIMSLL